jgi:DNA-binding SARP family transcriptional activator/energy-coupling factor transporter ATP-binding protein EcfA2
VTLLHISLLGPPAIHYDNIPVHIQRRMPRALLFYLASQGNFIGRAELPLMFWPDENEEDARRHLREVLSKLRANLPVPNLLLTDQDRIGLNFDLVYVDQLDFQQLIEPILQPAWQVPATIPLPDSIYQSLHKAIRLWRGPHFMAGANLPDSPAFDDWLSRTGQNLEHQRNRILERLGDHCTANGDHETAIYWFRQALENDELNEELHYRVMHLLAGMDHRSEAIKHYVCLKQLLRRELDIEPSPAIQSLNEKIQSELSLPEPKTRPIWPLRQTLNTPYIGRNQLIDNLQRKIQKSGFSVIMGETGTGKTRLIKECYNRMTPTPRLLLATCRPFENGLSFQPIIDLLRQFVAPEEWKSLPEIWIERLVFYLPELHTLYPNLRKSIPITPDQARSQFYEAFQQILLILAQSKRLFLFFDDAQYADEATLSAISYLLSRKFFPEYGFCLVAARNDMPNDSLQELIAIQLGTQKFPLTQVEPLTEDEISELSRMVLPRIRSSHFFNQLMRDSGGNVYFLLELLRSILELTPMPDINSNDFTFPFPSSIYKIVRERINRIHPDDLQILFLAAIIGNEFNILLLEKASGLRAEQVIGAIENLEKVHLIESIHNGYRKGIEYRFIHSKFREALLLEISPARKCLLHRRVARSMEDMPGIKNRENSEVMAQHFEAAGEFESAFYYWFNAAKQLQMHPNGDGTSLAYQKAETLLSYINLTEEQIREFYISWSEYARKSGEADLVTRLKKFLIDKT